MSDAPRDYDAEAAALRTEMAKPFASPDLQDQLNALYREQYPEDGSVPPRAAAVSPPAASTRDLDARLTALRTTMMTSSAPHLQEELNTLLQQRYPDDAEPAMSRDAWRPDLPSGYTWDGAVVAEFEETAPGAPTLMHVAADALRSSTRWHDPSATIEALEARHGAEEAEALAEDATSYVKAHVSPKIQAALKAQGLFYNPELIHLAASFWRQSRRG